MQERKLKIQAKGYLQSRHAFTVTLLLLRAQENSILCVLYVLCDGVGVMSKHLDMKLILSKSYRTIFNVWPYNAVQLVLPTPRLMHYRNC